MSLIILLSTTPESQEMQTILSTWKDDGFHEIFCTKMIFFFIEGGAEKAEPLLEMN